jgi:hypothetical protein
MTLQIMALTATLLTFNSIQSMNFIQKNIKKNSAKKDDSPSIKRLFYIQLIGTKNNLPNEIVTLLQQYTFQLNNKLFEQNFAHIAIWHSFCIPISYHQLLTTPQIRIIEELFQQNPLVRHKKKVELYYILNSQKDYQTFLTLPIEVRKQLTKMPNSEPSKTSYFNPSDNINSNKIIFIKKKSGYQSQLIIPEEKQ